MGLENLSSVFNDISENIKKRSFDKTTIGKNQTLGSGDYVLETLYLNNHRGSPERIQIG